MIINKIREYVQAECKSSNNAFGDAFFSQHILIVSEYAKRLANLLNADREVVEISAFLHDISAIQDFNTLSRHPAAGSEIAEGFLKKLSYDSNKIDSVKQCILTHSAPVQIGQGLIEEVCVSNADAISQIVNPAYWLYYIFSIRKFSFEEGLEWYSKRIDSNWNMLIEQARDMISDKYYQVKSSF